MTTENIDQQIRLYGQPLSERFGGVVSAYGITQRRLAEVLGLSAPMLSQLSSGRRIKIGNPAVYERLVMLEERAGSAEPETVLHQVQESQPVLTTTQIHTGTPTEAQAVASLAAVVPPEELVSAVEVLAAQLPGTPNLAALLRQAAQAAQEARGDGPDRPAAEQR